MITLTFDPSLFRLDMTNEAYLKAVRTSTTTLQDGYDYINSVTFRTDALSSTSVRFYKLNTTNNYTYPYVNNTFQYILHSRHLTMRYKNHLKIT